MALDRQSIEKKDFPIGRRGYDPDAVDSHLKAVADEIDGLRRSERKRSETLASAASEQVRAIVEAAETSASAIQRQAEEEAARIRSEADAECRQAREGATEQARSYVNSVSERTTSMLKGLEAMESELRQLVDSVRSGATRLSGQLVELEGGLTELLDTTGAARTRFEPEARPAPQAPVPAPSPRITLAPSGRQQPPGPKRDSDPEGARLVALNMALNGTPRDETERYLAENFDLSDRGRLLDEVYASVGG